MMVYTSCKKDDVHANSGKVELLSFGPAGVKHGEEIRFIGSNLDKVTDIDLQGVSVPSSAFLEQTKELIIIIVPQETEKGVVTLKTPGGDIVSKTEIDFEVPVKIISVPETARPGDEITITGEYMNWIVGVGFSQDTVVTEFVRRSLTELVVTIPLTAQTGPLVFLGGGTEPLTIEMEEELVLTLPSIIQMSPNPIERGGTLTIVGNDLDLTEGIIFKGQTNPVSEFVSKTSTELVVKIPEEINKGKISLVAYSGVAVESDESLLLIGDLPDLAPLAYAIYIDGLENGAQDWGWNTKTDFKNTDNVRDGEAAMKVIYDASWGGIKLSNFSVATTSYSELAFSIFGTLGTDGQKLNVAVNDGAAYVITIEEGKWVEYKLKLSELGSPNPLSNIMFQEAGWAGTIYIDHVGLR